jgi:tetratricopeptide (TPR) repeat protein
MMWEGSVHEGIVVPFGRSKPNSGLVVEHRPDPAREASNTERNLALLEDAVVAGDRSPGILFNYGNALYDQGLFKEAESMYRQYLAVDEEGADRYWGLLYLAESLLALADLDGAANVAIQAMVDDPSRAEAYVVKGRVHFDRHEWDEAIPLFVAASAARRPPMGLVRNSDYVYGAWDYLSVCYEKVGRHREGLLAAMNALRANPQADRVRANMRWMVDHL